MPVLLTSPKRLLWRQIFIVAMLVAQFLIHALIGHKPIYLGWWHIGLNVFCFAGIASCAGLHLYQVVKDKTWNWPLQSLFWLFAIGLLLCPSPTVLFHLQREEYWRVLRALSAPIFGIFFLYSFSFGFPLKAGKGGEAAP